MVSLGLHVQALPAGLAGREPLSHHTSAKHFGCSSLLLLFMLPVISLGCKALEVVVLCGEVLCCELVCAHSALSVYPSTHSNTNGSCKSRRK